jgi:hypothetical protein
MISMHPFQKSGLGIAPFRCVGVSENVFVMPGGHSKAGGSCDYCGTGIRWEFLIESADDKTFKVGCDCVAKTYREYGEEVANFRAVRLSHARELRAAGAEVRRQARQKAWDAQRAIWAQERQEATAAWRDEHADLIARIEQHKGKNDFLYSMADAIKHYGRLTDRQQQSAERSLLAIERIERQRRSSRHVGTIGQRIKNAQARITRCVVIGTEPFYPYAKRFCVTLEDLQGNSLVWFTGNGGQPFDEFSPCAYTVKDHGEYDGVQQTVVSRLMWKD